MFWYIADKSKVRAPYCTGNICRKFQKSITYVEFMTLSIWDWPTATIDSESLRFFLKISFWLPSDSCARGFLDEFWYNFHMSSHPRRTFQRSITGYLFLYSLKKGKNINGVLQHPEGPFGVTRNSESFHWSRCVSPIPHCLTLRILLSPDLLLSYLCNTPPP